MYSHIWKDLLKTAYSMFFEFCDKTVNTINHVLNKIFFLKLTWANKADLIYICLLSFNEFVR